MNFRNNLTFLLILYLEVLNYDNKLGLKLIILIRYLMNLGDKNLLLYWIFVFKCFYFCFVFLLN